MYGLLDDSHIHGHDCWFDNCFSVWLHLRQSQNVTSFGISNSNSLIEPTDLKYNICGYAKGSGNNNKDDLAQYPYLWYPFDIKVSDLTQSQILDAFSLGICVEQCPTAMFYSINVTSISNLASATTPQVGSWVCSYDYKEFEKNATYGAIRAQTRDNCYPNFLPTIAIGKRCIPIVDNSTLNSASKTLFNTVVFFSSTLQTGLGEVVNAWPSLLISSALAIILCLLFVIFVRLFLGLLVNVILILVLLIIGAAGGYFLYSGTISLNFLTCLGYTRYNYSTDGTEARKYAYVFLGVGGAFLLADICYAFMLIWLFPRVKCAVAILKEASKALFAMPTLLMAPPITVLLVGALFTYWVVVTIFLQSTSTPVVLDTDSLASLQKYTSMNISNGYSIRKNDATIQGMVWYNLFGFLWIMNLLFSISYMSVSMSVVQWYFSARGKERKRTPMFVLLRNFVKVVFFHIGTLMLGSLIVAIVQIFRIAFRKLTERLKKVKAAAIVSKIIEGLLWVLEKIIKYINKNAYITVRASMIIQLTQ